MLPDREFDYLLWVLDYVAESGPSEEGKFDVTDAAKALIRYLIDNGDVDGEEAEKWLAGMRSLRFHFGGSPWIDQCQCDDLVDSQN